MLVTWGQVLEHNPDMTTAIAITMQVREHSI